MFQRQDWIIGVVSIIIGCGVLFGSREWVGLTALDPAGPAAMPTLLAWGILIIGLIHFIGAYRAPKDTQDAEKKSWITEYKPVMQITLVCAIYNLALEHIGYLLMTPLLIIGIMWVFRVREVKALLQTSISTTIILFAVFHWALNIKLPMGILVSIIR